MIIIFFINYREWVKQGSMNMAAGKRHMLCQDPPAAVAAFSEAAEQLGKAFGETGNELGEAYFYYGKALLEMARMEAGVIDNVLDGGQYHFCFRFLVQNIPKAPSSPNVT